MDNDKNQLVEKIKAATNILVTVSNSPSVDQLTACLGMTLWLNKLGKHATAVFSGDIPNAVEFLQPEATIEKTTDSLRDFIIALDKSKADKLRYKVEDRVVKIFITPYRTNLSSADLEFSQGDFNVDAIVAIGVTNQVDLDNAIVSHGRILHDAVVTTINTTGENGIGAVNWRDPSASSLSELVYELCNTLDESQIDPQISTAILTGIVAETNRFSNKKTTPHTMSIAAALMAAGANQQLVSTKLDEASQANQPKEEKEEYEEKTDQVAEEPKEEKIEEPPKVNDGSLAINHDLSEVTGEPPNIDSMVQSTDSAETVTQQNLPSVNTDTQSDDQSTNQVEPAIDSSGVQSNQHIIIEPPTLGGTLTANSRPDDFLEPTTDPFSQQPVDENQILNREPLQPVQSSPEPVSSQPIAEPQSVEPNIQAPEITTEPKVDSEAHTDANFSNGLSQGQTLSEIEQSVNSPHIAVLRDQVQDALKAGPLPDPGPTEALTAINVDLNNTQDSASESQVNHLAFNPANFEVDSQEEPIVNPNDPPQVPPPIVPPDFLPPSPPQ